MKDNLQYVPITKDPALDDFCVFCPECGAAHIFWWFENEGWKLVSDPCDHYVSADFDNWVVAFREEIEQDDGLFDDDFPSISQLEEWLQDGIAEATDGCIVELDGYCPHGCPSWFIELGLI